MTRSAGFLIEATGADITLAELTVAAQRPASRTGSPAACR